MSRDRFKLQPKLVEQTLAQLHERIDERFPGSGLAKVCSELLEISRDAERRSNWLGRPLYWLRVVALVMIIVIFAALIGQFFLVNWTEDESLDWSEFIQGMEAAVNELVLIMAGIFFMFTLENRYKRRKGLKAIHELRSIAHVIDMHQLTKDPERSQGKAYQATKSSPAVTLDNFQLRRYLDYCSELLALTGKIAAVYLNHFDDPVMVSSVNEVETLTTDLSRKIWQKIMILHSFEQEGAGQGLAAVSAMPSVPTGAPQPPTGAEPQPGNAARERNSSKQ
jgi:hypothetical protein